MDEYALSDVQADKKHNINHVSRPKPAYAAQDYRLPDFFLIGAMKAGSSSLYRFLEQHPAIHLSNPKEPEYFSHHYGNDEEKNWYLSLFADAKDGQLCGDCSTGYSRNFDSGSVARRIATDIPHAKILYLLRHPVDRAWSHYRHRMNEWAAEGNAPLPFYEAVKDMPDILEASKYSEYIKEYLRYFDRSQLKIIILDEMLRDAESTSDEIDAFLDLEPQADRSFTRENPSGDLSVRRKVNRMTKRLEGNRFVRVLSKALPGALKSFIRQKILGAEWFRSVISLFTRKAEINQRMDADMRRQLLDYFEPYNEELAKFLGRRLPEEWHY